MWLFSASKANSWIRSQALPASAESIRCMWIYHLQPRTVLVSVDVAFEFALLPRHSDRPVLCLSRQFGLSGLVRLRYPQIGIYFVYPPPRNSQKWRFIRIPEPQMFHVILGVTIASGVDPRYIFWWIWWSLAAAVWKFQIIPTGMFQEAGGIWHPQSFQQSFSSGFFGIPNKNPTARNFPLPPPKKNGAFGNSRSFFALKDGWWWRK